MTSKDKAPPKWRTPSKNLGGRSARPMPELMLDTPENITNNGGL